MKFVNYFTYATFALALSCTAASCSSDDDPATNNEENKEEQETVDPSKAQFIVTSSDLALDLKGPANLQLFTDLTQTPTDVQITGSDKSTVAPDAFTQMSWNAETETFTGYIYGRGALVLGQAGLRNYKVVDGKFVEVGNPVLVDNFGNTGTFGKYSYAAQISNPYVMRVARDGDNVSSTNIHLADFESKYAIDGTMPAITEIVDRGNNQLVLSLYYSNRDSAAVAFTDYDLNIQSVQYDGRIGASYGAWRSVRYAQTVADDKGNVYVFSGQTKNAGHIGALKIAKGSNTFDANYHFDIAKASDNIGFRKVYHISGDYFLLECFTKAGDVAVMSTSGKMAVVNMADKTLKWVTGFPEDPSTITIGFPDSYDGKIYVPVSGKSAGQGGGGGRPSTRAGETVTPAIYVIGTDGVATKGMTFKNTELLKGITILK